MKSSTRIVFALIYVLAVGVAVTLAQESEMALGIEKAANSGLEQARRVIAQSNNPALLGLESVGEADRARLGAPVRVGTLSFDALLEYQSDTDLGKYLAGPARAVVPVEVDGDARAWISLEKDGEAWKLTGFGESTHARNVEKVLRSAPAGTQVSLVHAPAFNLHLVSVTGDGKTKLIPVGPSTVGGLKPGEAIAAGEALALLAEHARKIETEFGEEIRARRVVD